jgi:hypothetical protein
VAEAEEAAQAAEPAEAVGAVGAAETGSAGSTVSASKTIDPIRVSQNPLGLYTTLYIGK